MGADHTVLVDKTPPKELAGKIRDTLGCEPDVTLECSGAGPSISTGIYVCCVYVCMCLLVCDCVVCVCVCCTRMCVCVCASYCSILTVGAECQEQALPTPPTPPPRPPAREGY